jgi:head-tail adaptor
MLAGRKDRFIRLEKKNTVRDPVYKTETDEWVEYADMVPAEVHDIVPSRAEADRQGITIANKPRRIRFQWMDGVTSDMRVVLLDRGNAVLQIVAGPAELGRRRDIEIVAEEYSSQEAAP